jgi:hypothetical protein
VGEVLASGAIALSAGNLTIANGSAGSTEVTVIPIGGYNGGLVWSIAVTGTSTTAITGCYSIAPLLVDVAEAEEATPAHPLQRRAALWLAQQISLLP